MNAESSCIGKIVKVNLWLAVTNNQKVAYIVKLKYR